MWSSPQPLNLKMMRIVDRVESALEPVLTRDSWGRVELYCATYMKRTSSATGLVGVGMLAASKQTISSLPSGSPMLRMGNWTVLVPPMKRLSYYR